jgi:hypothetical protein
MNKRTYRILMAAVLMTAASSTIFYACKKPTEGFDYVINSSVFNYTASLRFTDPSNNNAVPAGLKVTVQGTIASEVYDLSGFKNLQVSNQGVVSFGLTEKGQPTTADVPVTLLVEATGFRTESVTVVFKKDKPNIALQEVEMLNLTKASEGVAVKVETVPVAGATVTAPVVVATPPPTAAAPSTQAAEITIPTNTQLRDAAGNAVNTTAINVVVANIDVEKPAALDFIPNSALVQNAVVNNVVQKVAFATAGVTTIEIKAANGTPITNFSQPINVRTTLDPATINPNTGTPIKDGDPLDYYSYTTATNTWKFESTGAVQLVNGKLVTDIPVTHLSTWISVVRTTVSLACPQNAVLLNITGPNLPATSTDVYKVQFYSESMGKLIKEVATTISQANNNITLNDLTTGNIKVTVLGPLGNMVGQSTINLCTGGGGTISINFPQPTTTAPLLTVDITGKCQSGTLKFSSKAPQGIIVYYKETASATYLPLGSVTDQGKLVTSLLDKTKTYDFMTNFTLSDGSKMAPTRVAQTLTGFQSTYGASAYSEANGGTTATITFDYVVPSKYCQ